MHTIFGTGPVGIAIAQILHEQGVQHVRMVNRSGRAPQPLPAGVELLKGDLTEPLVASKLAQGSNVIYQAVSPPYHQWLEVFPALQAAILSAAEATQAKLVVMDNLYMYGDPHGKPLTEDLPYAAETKKGRLRAQLAEELLAAHQAGRVQVTLGRASDFIGPGVMQSVMGGELVINAALHGKPAQTMGDIDTPHSYTYTPDIGRALVTLAQSADSWGHVWHLPTPKAVSTRNLLELIYAETGQPLKVRNAPKWLLRMLGLFNPAAGEMVEMLYEFQQPFILDDSKFVQHFGWGATPLQTVVKETVAWFKTQAA